MHMYVCMHGWMAYAYACVPSGLEWIRLIRDLSVHLARPSCCAFNWGRSHFMCFAT